MNTKATFTSRFRGLTKWQRANVVLRMITAFVCLFVFIALITEQARGNEINPVCFIATALAVPIDIMFIWTILYPESKVGRAFHVKVPALALIVNFFFAGLMSQAWLWMMFNTCGGYGCLEGQTEWIGPEPKGYPYLREYYKRVVSLYWGLEWTLVGVFVLYTFYFFGSIYDFSFAKKQRALDNAANPPRDEGLA